MKKVMILLMAVMITSCGPDNKPGTSNKYYYDVSGVVVKVGTDIAPDGSKFHTPTAYHLMLIKMIGGSELIPKGNGAKRSISDTTLFYEYKVSDEVYYNTRVGDTLKLEYVYKDAWFQIKDR